MGRAPDPPGGSEPGVSTYIHLTGRLDDYGLALVDVILAHPDTRLIGQVPDLETLHNNELPDGSARHPGLIDTGANRSSITPELLGFLGLQEDGGHRRVKRPSDPEWRQEPTYAVKMVFGGAFEIGISVTADLMPPQGQRYRALLGCDVLAACRLTYEGPHTVFPGGDAGGYTLHVPDFRPGRT